MGREDRLGCMDAVVAQSRSPQGTVEKSVFLGVKQIRFTGQLSPTLYKDATGLGSHGAVERVGRDDSRERRTALGLRRPLLSLREGLSLAEMSCFSPEI